MESMKLAMKTDEKKVMESINAILPDGAMQIKKVILKGADKGIYVKQNTLNIFITWHNTIALLAEAINYQYTNLQLARLSLFPQLG